MAKSKTNCHSCEKLEIKINAMKWDLHDARCGRVALEGSKNLFEAELLNIGEELRKSNQEKRTLEYKLKKLKKVLKSYSKSSYDSNQKEIVNTINNLLG